MKTQTFKLSTTKSEIAWIGRKVTGAHNGTIAVKQGSLSFTADRLTGGQFTIDTTSIKILDLTDPAANAQFAGHLASDDFFSSDKFPTAGFEITSTERKTSTVYDIIGNLTIKGITHPICFEADIKFNEQSVRASGNIVINRVLFDMKFRSGNFFQNLGDSLIYDDFDLNVNITAEPVVAELAAN